MSFLSELKKQRDKLKQMDTIVTNFDGQRFVESKNNEGNKTLFPSTYGFVVDTKPDNIPVLIVNHLYIGSQDCAVNNVILTYNIKHVLSLGINLDISVDNKYIPCLDLPETNIKYMLVESLPYLRHNIECKENVLVHCNAGVSRTSTVAIAYLMQYDGMDFDDAYNLVKSKRPAIQPNAGFKRQLQAMKPGEFDLSYQQTAIL